MSSISVCGLNYVSVVSNLLLIDFFFFINHPLSNINFITVLYLHLKIFFNCYINFGIK